MKTVIEMAREAADPDKVDPFRNGFWVLTQEELEKFSELVRADEAEKYKWDVHSCGPTCDKAACVAMREAVLAERDACAKVCESFQQDPYEELLYKSDFAAAIRARNNK